MTQGARSNEPIPFLSQNEGAHQRTGNDRRHNKPYFRAFRHTSKKMTEMSMSWSTNKRRGSKSILGRLRNNDDNNGISVVPKPTAADIRASKAIEESTTDDMQVEQDSPTALPSLASYGPIVPIAQRRKMFSNPRASQTPAEFAKTQQETAVWQKLKTQEARKRTRQYQASLGAFSVAAQRKLRDMAAVRDRNSSEGTRKKIASYSYDARSVDKLNSANPLFDDDVISDDDARDDDGSEADVSDGDDGDDEATEDSESDSYSDDDGATVDSFGESLYGASDSGNDSANDIDDDSDTVDLFVEDTLYKESHIDNKVDDSDSETDDTNVEEEEEHLDPSVVEVVSSAPDVDAVVANGVENIAKEVLRGDDTTLSDNDILNQRQVESLLQTPQDITDNGNELVGISNVAVSDNQDLEREKEMPLSQTQQVATDNDSDLGISVVRSSLHLRSPTQERLDVLDYLRKVDEIDQKEYENLYANALREKNSKEEEDKEGEPSSGELSSTVTALDSGYDSEVSDRADGLKSADVSSVSSDTSDYEKEEEEDDSESMNDESRSIETSNEVSVMLNSEPNGSLVQVSDPQHFEDTEESDNNMGSESEEEEDTRSYVSLIANVVGGASLLPRDHLDPIAQEQLLTLDRQFTDNQLSQQEYDQQCTYWLHGSKARATLIELDELYADNAISAEEYNQQFTKTLRRSLTRGESFAIDLNSDPTQVVAAVKLQAMFRGREVRNKLLKAEEKNDLMLDKTDDANSDDLVTRIQDDTQFEVQEDGGSTDVINNERREVIDAAHNAQARYQLEALEDMVSRKQIDFAMYNKLLPSILHEFHAATSDPTLLTSDKSNSSVGSPAKIPTEHRECTNDECAANEHTQWERRCRECWAPLNEVESEKGMSNDLLRFRSRASLVAAAGLQIEPEKPLVEPLSVVALDGGILSVYLERVGVTAENYGVLHKVFSVVCRFEKQNVMTKQWTIPCRYTVFRVLREALLRESSGGLSDNLNLPPLPKRRGMSTAKRTKYVMIFLKQVMALDMTHGGGRKSALLRRWLELAEHTRITSGRNTSGRFLSRVSSVGHHSDASEEDKLMMSDRSDRWMSLDQSHTDDAHAYAHADAEEVDGEVDTRVKQHVDGVMSGGQRHSRKESCELCEISASSSTSQSTQKTSTNDNSSGFSDATTARNKINFEETAQNKHSKQRASSENKGSILCELPFQGGKLSLSYNGKSIETGKKGTNPPVFKVSCGWTMAGGGCRVRWEINGQYSDFHNLRADLVGALPDRLRSVPGRLRSEAFNEDSMSSSQIKETDLPKLRSRRRLGLGALSSTGRSACVHSFLLAVFETDMAQKERTGYGDSALLVLSEVDRFFKLRENTAWAAVTTAHIPKVKEAQTLLDKRAKKFHMPAHLNALTKSSTNDEPSKPDGKALCVQSYQGGTFSVWLTGNDAAMDYHGKLQRVYYVVCRWGRQGSSTQQWPIVCRYAQYRELRNALTSGNSNTAMSNLPKLPRGTRINNESTGATSVSALRAPERAEKIQDFIRALLDDSDVDRDDVLLDRPAINDFFEIMAHIVDKAEVTDGQRVKKLPPRLPPRVSNEKSNENNDNETNSDSEEVDSSENDENMGGENNNENEYEYENENENSNNSNEIESNNDNSEMSNSSNENNIENKNNAKEKKTSLTSFGSEDEAVRDGELRDLERLLQRAEIDFKTNQALMPSVPQEMPDVENDIAVTEDDKTNMFLSSSPSQSSWQ